MIFEDHPIKDLLLGLEGEVAKTLNEIRDIESTLEKVKNRQKFTLAIIHHLKSRYGDM